MARNKKPHIEKVAEELAKIAVRHLSHFSEEEQERRILAAEELVASPNFSPATSMASEIPCRGAALLRPNYSGVYIKVF